jgi:hypothetical protein
MKRGPDHALEVALEQRQRVLDAERQTLARSEIAVSEQARLLAAAQSRVQMVLKQMAAALVPRAGLPLAVALLGDLERLMQWCEGQVKLEKEKLEAARGAAEVARGAVAEAHQQVRALELVLESRAQARVERERRVELRLADETAARVHAQSGWRT